MLQCSGCVLAMILEWRGKDAAWLKGGEGREACYKHKNTQMHKYK